MNRPIAIGVNDKEVGSLPVEQMRKKKRMEQVNIVKSVYDTINNFKKEDGKLLCDSFIRAPKSRQEPTYYDVAYDDIDMIKIQQKIKTDEYDDVNGLQADIELLTNNAKSFYKENSQEYKDAVVLWDVFLTTKNNLLEREETPEEKIDMSVGKLEIRGVSAASVSKSEQTDEKESNSSLASGDDDLVKCEDNDNRLLSELLTSLFTNVYNHQDEEGRKFSDSMAELPEHDDVCGNKIRGLSLDLIKQKLDSNQYKQLDTFQNDLFAFFKRARKLSCKDSQIFEDSIELQAYFIKKRDEVWQNGNLPKSPALNYSLFNLSVSVHNMRERKIAEDFEDEDVSISGNEDDDIEDLSEIRGVSAASVSKSEQTDEKESNSSLASGVDDLGKCEDNDNRLLSELLTSLFTNVYNHQDEEGRKFSDSMAELPEHDDVCGNKIRGLSLDLIKQKLDSNQYKQLDTFQNDLFAFFKRARKLSCKDSQIFEDSIELQAYFIKKRDEVWQNGNLPKSPALNYSLFNLSVSVHNMRERKIAEDFEDEDVSISGNEDDDEDFDLVSSSYVEDLALILSQLSSDDEEDDNDESGEDEDDDYAEDFALVLSSDEEDNVEDLSLILSSDDEDESLSGKEDDDDDDCASVLSSDEKENDIEDLSVIVSLLFYFIYFILCFLLFYYFISKSNYGKT